MRWVVSLAFLSVLILGARSRGQAPPNPEGPDAILLALAKSFGDKRALAQIKKDNALIRAAGKGDLEGVRKALKEGALVDSIYLDGSAFLGAGTGGYTALMRASYQGHIDVVKALLEARADPDVPCRALARRGQTSLYFAVRAEKEAIVQLLVKAGSKGDPKRIRLTYDLHRAACRGFEIRKGEGFPPYPGSIGDPSNAPTITEVLERGANVNGADPQGHTALMYAANLGLVENVKVLLARGADATRKSSNEETALSMAERESSVARAERREVVALLRAHLARKK